MVVNLAAGTLPDDPLLHACVVAYASDLTLLDTADAYARYTDHHFGTLSLSGSAPDYLRFAQMLLNGGELDGVRLVKRDTLELMRRNQLPRDIANMGAADFNKEKWDGIGFGLGFSVVLLALIAIYFTISYNHSSKGSHSNRKEEWCKRIFGMIRKNNA